MFLQVKQSKLSHSWWFESHKSSPRSSPWLASTLEELDDKTKAMLKLIEQDADSFAQRAEMYYKKRPELVSMVEDFYRAYRSLAERFDLLRHETAARRRADSSCSKNLKETKASSSSSNCSESEESDVDDPDQEECDVGSHSKEKLKRMAEQLCRLKEENAGLRVELLAKDEEKREVIRQLSLSINILKEENSDMRVLIKESRNKGPLEFKKPLVQETFLSRYFGSLSIGNFGGNRNSFSL
ncbi:kinase interacting (KIP1-like) family protein [Wolffia australiana]